MTSIRELIQRKLSPRAYHSVRFCWWHIHYYLPHRAAAAYFRDTPRVHGFPSGESSELVHEIRDINVFSPTTMCRVMTKHGSDKGEGWHNYTTIYSRIFRKFSGRPIRIFEIGLGTTNPNFAHNMGVDGRPGASLRGWRELFPTALIYGADVDRDILFKEDGIETFYCDQLDRGVIRDLWSQPGLQARMEIIVDDGLHTFEANTLFMDECLDRLKRGGVYVVEDIFKDTIESCWRPHLEVYAKGRPNHEFALAELPSQSNNKGNNNLLIVRSRE